jgi:hypothetical protein
MIYSPHSDSAIKQTSENITNGKGREGESAGLQPDAEGLLMALYM